MLSHLEKKTKDKILNLENEKKEFSTLLKNNVNLQMELEELIDAYEQLKKFKTAKNISLILDIIFLLLIHIDPIFIGLILFVTMAFFAEKDIINELKKFIKNSNFKNYKQENLEIEYDRIEDYNNKIKEVISNKVIAIKKYQKIIEEIKYVRDLEENIDNKNFEQLKELYFAVPVLAFNSEKEYKNYLSYDNEFIKDEILNSKILNKHKI